MPHIDIKLWPGKTEAQKQELAAAIVESFKKILGSSDASLSVAMTEVDSKEWKEKVVTPEIIPQLARLYKKPGYEI